MISIRWKIFIILSGIYSILSNCFENYYLNKYPMKWEKKKINQDIYFMEDFIDKKNIIEYDKLLNDYSMTLYIY